MGKGLTYQTAVLNGGKSFYGQPEYAGCYGPKQLVVPLVKPSPFSGFNYDILANQSVKVSPINAGGCSVLWNFGDGIKSTNAAVTHKYINAGTYQLKLILTSLLNGCKDSTEYTVVVAASGLKVLQTLPVLNVFPNPTQQYLNMALPNSNGSIFANVYSVSGVLVASQNLMVQNQNAQLEVSQLPAGIYILRVEGYRTILFTKQ